MPLEVGLRTDDNLWLTLPSCFCFSLSLSLFLSIFLQGSLSFGRVMGSRVAPTARALLLSLSLSLSRSFDSRSVFHWAEGASEAPISF